MRAYERLLRYTYYPAASDGSSSSCPSTPEQLDIARSLDEELLALCMAAAHVDEHG